VSKERHRDIIQCLPHLRAFALLLSRDRTLADDLVQEAVVRALSNIDQFRAGTNFKAWITAILRNSYFSEIRRRERARKLHGEELWEGASVSGGQEARVEMHEFESAFGRLPERQREALVLVGASGFSYEEAAKIADCAVGTIKSRVSRARVQLELQLDARMAPPMSGSGSRPVQQQARN
jgi:RNA polymerase sigma-70 factor, ECF subfamily